MKLPMWNLQDFSEFFGMGSFQLHVVLTPLGVQGYF